MSFTLYKYQLKVDDEPKYKTWNFEASAGKKQGQILELIDIDKLGAHSSS
jgi:hypothetical protein